MAWGVASAAQVSSRLRRRPTGARTRSIVRITTAGRGSRALDVESLAATEPAPAIADVRPGDLLYLPAGWVHEVHQAPRTLAVNWWFGARCDGPRWAGAELARRVGELRSVQ